MTPEALFDPLARSQRRYALSRTPGAVGLDYVRVHATRDPRVWRLALHFVPADPSSGKRGALPDELTPANLRVTAEQGSGFPVPVVDSVVLRGGDRAEALLHLPAYAQTGGDPPRYDLELVNVEGTDWLFSSASFALSETPTDELRPHASPVGVAPVRTVSGAGYLAKDFASFRKLMLDRLTLVEPHWRERNVADLGIMVVELMAYAGDYLSYHQDAVATEAYLGTARRRPSLRRHARLLDYAVHEGCNAVVAVQLRMEETPAAELPAGAQLVTGGGIPEVVIQAGSAQHERLMARRPQVFETLHPVALRPEHNEIPLYTWGATEYVLPAGAVRATLRDAWEGEGRSLALGEGDLLVLEELFLEGEDGDPREAYRHAVKLVAVHPRTDLLGGYLSGEEGGEEARRGVPVLDVEWSAADALPRAMRVADARGQSRRRVSRALGNVVLADHGMTVEEDLPPVPSDEPYRPALRLGPVTWTVPREPGRPVSRTLVGETERPPTRLLPAASVWETAGDRRLREWRVRRDLLGSDRFARDFVLEVEEDETASLLFGDGTQGRRPAPGTAMRARYRVGNGTSGNVGREVVRHLVLDAGTFPSFLERVSRVWNPIGADGGEAPESSDSIRLNAPRAFHDQERCVTEADYAEVAGRYPGVRQAVAELRWTGSWNTAYVYVQRRGGRSPDAGFRARVRQFLEGFRPVGHDLQVVPPHPVPLDVALRVRVAPGHVRAVVERALLERFSDGVLPDGRPGYFHPDEWGFGETAYLSPLLAAALEVHGVAAVEPRRFTRWRSSGADEVLSEVPVGPTEVVQLRNEPRAPQAGRIAFRVEGGS